MRGDENLDISSILPENPQDYDNLAPPKEHGKATSVKFHVTVLSLDSIDEGSMTYVADIFMSQSWYDHRLRLPRNMTSKYRLLPVNWLHQMWRPDSFFKNAKRVTFQEMTYSKPLHMALLGRQHTLYGEAHSPSLVRDEVRNVPTRHTSLHDEDRKL
ncbi:hypothetical protein HPB49_009100 [Dermacentor silvarum]|uniref:Uncharacterized protein n=1 Tax=Dermacentor silvarum TaxID=543639 RepID=A0ACB8DNC5_DERSI|nr:hypothetical protein HPB49_009100 [Dermacentor silvarum]